MTSIETTFLIGGNLLLEGYSAGKNICRKLYFWVPSNIYLLKVNNRKTRTKCEICLKLTMNTPELRQ